MPPPPPPPLPHNVYNPHMMEANGQYQGKPEPRVLIVTMNVVTTITQLLLGAVTFCAFSFANVFEFANSFSQHIYLCVLGYVILMSQAIMTLNTHAGWAYSLKYPEKKIVHAVMQILGSILAIAGSIVRIIDLEEHFRTPHSITGIVAMLLTLPSLFGGVVNFICPAKFSTILFKAVHAGIGCLTISVAFICLCLGFNNWYKIIFGDINANVAIVFTVFALVGIISSAFTKTVLQIVNGEFK